MLSDVRSRRRFTVKPPKKPRSPSTSNCCAGEKIRDEVSRFPSRILIDFVYFLREPPFPVATAKSPPKKRLLYYFQKQLTRMTGGREAIITAKERPRHSFVELQYLSSANRSRAGYYIVRHLYNCHFHVAPLPRTRKSAPRDQFNENLANESNRERGRPQTFAESDWSSALNSENPVANFEATCVIK